MTQPPLRWLLIVGTPLALAVVMLFHPWPYDDYVGKLAPAAAWWTVLHTIQFALLPGVAAAAWLLTRGLQGPAAALSQAGAIVFGVAYTLGDALAGVATGIVAALLAQAPPPEQATLSAAIAALFQAPVTRAAFLAGSLGWVVCLLAAAVALARAGLPRLPCLLLLVPSALLYGFDHAAPYGSLCFGSFALLALWIERGRSSTPQAAAWQKHSPRGERGQA